MEKKKQNTINYIETVKQNKNTHNMENEYNKKVYQETTLPLNARTLPTIKIKTNTTTTSTIITSPIKCKTTTAAAITAKTTTGAETGIKATHTVPTAATTTTTTAKNPTGKSSKRRRNYYNRNDKSDLGENFIAPDGGWAWLVCIAAGVSNLSIYPCLQQFGFIFRERLLMLGLTSSQITTIINTNPAVSACTGLLNGPMFRRFTFRQVAMIGSLFVFGGILLTAFCETFIGYMITYALLLGFGMGISVSASSLAINTYFENRRRRAAGFSWTITGLGPIFLPYFVTFLLPIYGVQGTVLLFGALSLHSFVCALIYQPVYYHTQQPVMGDVKTEVTSCASDNDGDNNNGQSVTSMRPEYLCKYCTLREKREKGGIFSSQYLCQDDDVDRPGFEIIEPGTPMLSRANDGWYGSRMSLASGKLRFRSISSSKDLELTNRLNHIISEEDETLQTNMFFKPNNFSREREEQQHRNRSLRRHLSNACEFEGRHPYCTCAEEKALLEYTRIQRQHMNDAGLHDDDNDDDDADGDDNGDEDDNDDDDDDEGKVIGTTYDGKNSNSAERELQQQHLQMSFIEKVITFFDLDLLRDFTFVNLVIGLTIINFGELNFSILTPFILTDFGFDTSQITLAMSILAGLDITMRFLVPFLTEKIPWDNRVFFLIGVVGIALGRTVVACTRSYPVIMTSFVWIGLCKGVRTIFWPLIIPGYVPLNRLPGASGLQLLISGIFTLLAGPFVGLVRDRFDYSVTLHCLNMMTFIAAISWTLEALIRRRRRRRMRT